MTDCKLHPQKLSLLRSLAWYSSVCNKILRKGNYWPLLNSIKLKCFTSSSLNLLIKKLYSLIQKISKLKTNRGNKPNGNNTGSEVRRLGLQSRLYHFLSHLVKLSSSFWTLITVFMLIHFRKLQAVQKC